MAASTSSASSNSWETFQWKHDVFLSFRGRDTRMSFTDHLYAALKGKGINTYKDDMDLERGKNISELLQAIKDSRFSIVIFSKNYAASTWCLDELVAIIECVDLGKHTVVPIFYDVDPSEVLEQTDGYGEAMKLHEESFKDEIEKVKKWRNALTSVADHSGWHLKDRHEFEFIQEVVEDILKKLRKLSNKFSSLQKVLFGLDKHLLRMDEYLSVGLNDVRIIGICGMGGIGKTTIARAIYERFSSQFGGSSFLADVRQIHEQRGLVCLQEQLLSEILNETKIRIWNAYRGSQEIRDKLYHKMVLIILDDVSQIEQLEFLAGGRNWFGNGSRIIITTRDEHLLITHRVDFRYKVEELTDDEALPLFCYNAFKNEHPTSCHLQLCHEFIKYAKGLPLALHVLGRFVDGKKIYEWKSALDRLKRIPNNEVMKKLEISFHGLDETEKKIFLDIACFFNGKEQDIIMRIWESCGFDPVIGLRVLLDKSLISILHNKVRMHDLLREMGRDIVRRESPEEPERRSRLWNYKDVNDVLSNSMGTENIEGIMLQDSCEQEDGHLTNEALSVSDEVFLKMRRLRLLKLKCIRHGHDLNYLPNTLRYLDWLGYPFKYFPSKFQPDNLVELHMKRSKIQCCWKERKVLMMLKVIDLSFSLDLVNTPDFTKVPNLEELNLQGCVSLLEVDKSIGLLQRLVFLSLKDCKKLAKLPSSVCDLRSIKTLDLNGCLKLKELPEGLGNLSSLENLDMSFITERQQPSTKPWDFLNPCRLLQRMSKPLPLKFPSLLNLSSLRTINLRHCNLNDVAVLDNLSCCPLLEVLHLCGNNFVHLPEACISQLPKLEKLLCSNCEKLEALPDLPSNIVSVYTEGCLSLKSIPNSLLLITSNHSSLYLVNCYKLLETYDRDYLALICLMNFLHRYSKHGYKKPEEWNQNFHFTLCLPGDAIPLWFSNVSSGTFIRMNLPPFWCSNDWMGFALCACFGPQHAVSVLPNDTTRYYVHCLLSGNGTHYTNYDNMNFCRKTYPTSDHLWLIFCPRATFSMSEISLMGSSSIIDVIYTTKGLKVKECAFRVVYRQDIEELIQLYGDSNNLVISCPGNNKRKRSAEESCRGNEVGERSEGSPAKRLGI